MVADRRDSPTDRDLPQLLALPSVPEEGKKKKAESRAVEVRDGVETLVTET